MLIRVTNWRKWFFLIGFGICWWLLRRFVQSRYRITNRKNDDVVKNQLKKRKEDKPMSHDDDKVGIDMNDVKPVYAEELTRQCEECLEENQSLLRDNTNRMGTRTLCIKCMKILRAKGKTLYIPIKRAKKEGHVKLMSCSNCFNQVTHWRIIPTGGYLCLPCWAKIREN